MKPSLLNITVYWFSKYIAFYLFMMFRNKNYALITINDLKTGEDLFMYLWTFLFFPIVCMILFSIPLYFSFKAKAFVYFVLIVFAVLFAEYFIYTYLASQTDLMNGIYNGIISILFLAFFFFRHISNCYKQNVSGT
jgi:hypothetical protein